MKKIFYVFMIVILAWTVMFQPVHASPLNQVEGTMTIVSVYENPAVGPQNSSMTCEEMPSTGGIICQFSLTAIGNLPGSSTTPVSQWTVEWSDSRGEFDQPYYGFIHASAPDVYTSPNQVDFFSYYGGLTWSTETGPYQWTGSGESDTFVYGTWGDILAVTIRAYEGTVATFSGFFIISPNEIDPCDFVSLTPQAFNIDPTIEFPLGPEGDPADDQIFSTVTDSIYQIEIDGGPWNDGTDDHDKDVAISWDGETWEPLTDEVSLCVGKDGKVFYVVAESETLHIRVNDVDSAFADNYDNPDPTTYAIAEAFPLGGSCESQFSYDTGSDLVASVTVPGNDDDVFATGDLEPNEWYAITVTSGTWQDDGSPPDRTDLEFKVDGSKSYNEDADYHDLGSGEDGTWCQSTDETTWYIQAQNTDLSLRVNNESGTFSTNTGSLSVSIYHSSFVRNMEACEFDFSLYQEPMYSTVDANQVNGQEFAYASDFVDQTPLDGRTGGHRRGSYDSLLVPGAYYVLDTVDGPWSTVTGTSSNQLGVARYDMAVSTDYGSSWIPLEDWALPDCNVALDALGHRRIYFQVPLSEVKWNIRVNDNGTWNQNSGYMGWNLYKAISDSAVGTVGHHNPWIPCTDGYQLTPIATNNWIPPKWPLGIGLDAAANLEVGSKYALTISNGPWDDGDGDDTRFDAAILANTTGTWYPLSDSDNPHIICNQPDQAHRYWTIMFTVQADQHWYIRVNDDIPLDFVNNGGNLSYDLYEVGSPLNGSGTGTTGSFPGNHPNDVRSGVCDLGTFVPQFSIALPSNPDLPVPSGITDLQGIGELLVALVAEPISYSASLGSALVDATATYIGDWIDYASFAIRTYFAWCPRNTEALRAMMDYFKTREPVATIIEMNQVAEGIVQEVQGYDWNIEVVDSTIFTVSGRSQLNQMIQDRFFPTSSTARNPWSGGDVISFSNHSLPAYYYACSSLFTDYLPAGLKTGVCFVNAYARETGLSFFMQLVLDAGALFAIFQMLKGTVQDLVYMMTGVKPWVKSSNAGQSIDRLASFLEQRDKEQDYVERALSGRSRRRR